MTPVARLAHKRGRYHKVVKVSDPLLRQLLEHVAASPRSDQQIADEAGCDSGALSRIRRTGSARLGTVVAIAGALGFTMKLERDSAMATRQDGGRYP